MRKVVEAMIVIGEKFRDAESADDKCFPVSSVAGDGTVDIAERGFRRVGFPARHGQDEFVARRGTKPGTYRYAGILHPATVGKVVVR